MVQTQDALKDGRIITEILAKRMKYAVDGGSCSEHIGYQDEDRSKFISVPFQSFLSLSLSLFLTVYFPTFNCTVVKCTLWFLLVPLMLPPLKLPDEKACSLTQLVLRRDPKSHSFLSLGENVNFRNTRKSARITTQACSVFLSQPKNKETLQVEGSKYTRLGTSSRIELISRDFEDFKFFLCPHSSTIPLFKIYREYLNELRCLHLKIPLPSTILMSLKKRLTRFH